ncbi:MAG: ATP-dependent helicase [Anaerolineales bacterium]|uniref:ATP-dependent helicase n=1 Tax=Candidatus Villigracilis proximus TaxID=3140683 RepID=UPI003135F96A|nr:ATP-dependent helicase [Anaerolineales bacterium]
MTITFNPRPSQQNILRYNGGRLGIAAVPGAGKTHILSALAAQIIRDNQLQDGQEVLIVTLVNSAVDNFEARIKRFFENPIQALYKYRVRTLHGLAHDIVREKPASVGLEAQFSIIDEREAEFIRRESVNAWLAAHPDFLDDYLDPALDTSKRDWIRRQQLPNLVDSLALAFIRSAKDRLLTPDRLRLKLDASFAPLPLAELGWSIYADYQRALAYRGAVDFDDLIRLALTLLQNDEEYLERLRFRYPFILEDEAQDSSRTQQEILSLLSGGPSTTLLEDRSSLRSGWVRVGDPNQAIFETFTTADPDLLRDFIKSNPNADMPESGRSQPAVIALANHLIDWVMTSHPDPNVRTALSLPHIEPVPAGYEPVNPPDNSEGIKFISKKFTPEEELEAVVKSVKGYLDTFADALHEEKPTIAILVPRNQRGVEVVDSLRKRGVEAIELISSTQSTRAAAGSLNHLLSYLADPQSARKLSKAYEVFRRDWRGQASGDQEAGSGGGDPELMKTVADLLRRLVHVEKFIAPSQADDWLSAIGESEAFEVIEELREFRVNVQRWLQSVTLPIDQLVLTLAQDVFSAAPDLALAHKLALVLRTASNDHADWRLPELTSELAVIAKNERRFIGFSSDDSGFDPDRHRGKVVVTTMHKAKGMEWDRVYMMSVNNYDFPSNMPNDNFISEKWFVRTSTHSANARLNLEAEALAQLTALESTSEYDAYEEGTATLQSRLGYVKERLRLLYVGITRAKKDLIVTWNSGRQGDATPSLALSELMGWWEGQG